MRAICIDPGKDKSAAVLVRVAPGERHSPPWGIRVLDFWHVPNDKMRSAIVRECTRAAGIDFLAVEVMATVFARAGGHDQLIADRWAGRFMECFANQDKDEASIFQIYRQTAKAATIGKARGNDSDVRKALIAAFGGEDIAFGVKCRDCRGQGWKGRNHDPCESCMGGGWAYVKGPLYGMKGSHVFAALALSFALFEPGGHLDKRRAA